MADTFVEHSLLRMVEKVSKYAIFLLAPDGTVRTWNPAATAIKGYEAEEIIGLNYDVLYTDEGRRENHPQHNLHKAAEHGTFEEEAWRVRKNGTQFWALIEIIAITDEIGTVTGFCKLTRDITKRRQTELALKEADQRKNEFLAMLAHELRNPLAPVSAAAALLTMGDLGPESVKKASGVIVRQVKHMTELVDDLLDVSRVSRGQVEVNRLPIDMKTVVRNAIEQVRPLIESREHTLATKVLPGKAYVSGDEKRLIQVISNLLNNAAKYTLPGGSISVELCTLDKHVCVEVIDDGVGIAPNVQTQIFGLFEQVQRTPDRTQGGLGIGLALVQKLVELHGGTVKCQSEGLGYGSSFTICLPMISEGEFPDRRETPRAKAMPTAARRLSIVVVDDNVDAAEMIQFFLTSSGHYVRVAHTARQALELVKATVPDACILDIGLPDVTGNELAVAIRRLTLQTPILIALTGYGTARDQKEALSSGFDHYFVKPADLDALVEVLMRLTSEKCGR